ALRGRDPRQLFRDHGTAAVRDRPADRPPAVSESMSEEVLINVTPQETRVAIIGAGVVQELLIERAANRGLVGNIYVGRVARALPGLPAAVVESVAGRGALRAV